MGKDVQHQPLSIPFQNNNPGCMWNILHHMNNRRWHHARKRLAIKSYDAGKQANVVGDSVDSGTTSGAGVMQENLDATVNISSVEGNSTESGSIHKSSTKSRIKALITEQVKRRGRHRRSSSDPIRKQLGRTISIHHLEFSDVNPSAEIALDCEIVGNQDNAQSSVAGSLDPFLEKVSDGTATMLALNCQKQTEVNKLRRQPVGDHNLLQGKFMHEMVPSKYASVQESKLFLDALDLLNMREELFMKILQDPNCSFANQLHGRRRSKRFGLTKSVSFPVAGSSGRINYKSNIIPEEEDNKTSTKDFNKHLLTSRGAFLEDGTHENLPPSSSRALKKRHENKVVMKRFKNLREKLKHAIWESKNEKRRIVMDAVLHKVPYGRRVSKEAKEDSHMHNGPVTDKSDKYSQGSDQLDSGVGKNGAQDIKRTSSFNESLDRYSGLLEISFSREEKHHISEELRLRTRTPSPIRTTPATLARILSLPDLRSYSYFPSDDSPGDSSLNAPLANSAGNASIVSNQPGEQRSSGRDSESKIQPEAVSESGNQEYLSGVIETFDDNDNLETMKKSSSLDINFENSLSSSQAVFEPNSHYQEDEIGPDNPMSITKGEDSLAIQLYGPSSDSSTVQENTVDTNNVESRVEEFYSKLLFTREDKSEFNYVKDVLELSGFSGNEILGKWHSAEQPVDPSVFEEVEGCLIDQPDCFGYEEGGFYNHLLLFDLINEVLLHIYERSFSYWQKPLTCQSHIHRMPFGYHVLEEVWADISWYLSWKPEIFLTLDDAVRRDLAKVDGWMNLQFDAEFVSLDMEDLIFDDLLEELIFD